MYERDAGRTSFLHSTQRILNLLPLPSIYLFNMKIMNPSAFTRKASLLLLPAAMLLFAACESGQRTSGTPPPTPSATTISIPLGGNSYVTTVDKNSQEKVTKEGLSNWSSTTAVYSVYFRTSQTGPLDLFLKYKLDIPIKYRRPSGSKIKATCQGQSFDVKLKEGEQTAFIGRVVVADTGYIRLDLQGIERSADTFALATDLLIQGKAAQATINYVGDFSFYWGRRGPSVHIGYPFPDGDTIEWFYNEVTVPLEQDPSGSYYMANGFAQGYFGIQVNSAMERRVLFSVWSPFETDDPKSIPDDQKIILLKKGDQVRTGEFGNEGSGGQSYLIYPWKTGNTYKFITQIKPDGKGNTRYTAYFYTPDENRWMLIASFSRPHTDAYYQRAHSFLECFNPELGYLSRKAYYTNQWARTIHGKWINLTTAKFTADATARAKARIDYKGGAEGNKFFLQNGGFLSDYTVIGSMFSRTADSQQPDVDISQLP